MSPESTTPPPGLPQPVVVSRGRFPSDRAKPWRWESRDYRPSDPRYRARYHFEDCEAAYNDATAAGHTDIEVVES